MFERMEIICFYLTMYSVFWYVHWVWWIHHLITWKDFINYSDRWFIEYWQLWNIYVIKFCSEIDKNYLINNEKEVFDINTVHWCSRQINFLNCFIEAACSAPPAIKFGYLKVAENVQATIIFDTNSSTIDQIIAMKKGMILYPEEGDIYPSGSVVQYGCDEGYRLDPLNFTNICNNGRWLAKTPLCGKYIYMLLIIYCLWKWKIAIH